MNYWTRIGTPIGPPIGLLSAPTRPKKPQHPPAVTRLIRFFQTKCLPIYSKIQIEQNYNSGNLIANYNSGNLIANEITDYVKNQDEWQIPEYQTFKTNKISKSVINTLCDSLAAIQISSSFRTRLNYPLAKDSTFVEKDSGTSDKNITNGNQIKLEDKSNRKIPGKLNICQKYSDDENVVEEVDYMMLDDRSPSPKHSRKESN